MKPSHRIIFYVFAALPFLGPVTAYADDELTGSVTTIIYRDYCDKTVPSNLVSTAKTRISRHSDNELYDTVVRVTGQREKLSTSTWCAGIKPIIAELVYVLSTRDAEQTNQEIANARIDIERERLNLLKRQNRMLQKAETRLEERDADLSRRLADLDQEIATARENMERRLHPHGWNLH